MATPEMIEIFLNGPAGMPPPGVTPNFEDPPSLYNFFIVTIVFCVTFTTLAVQMRFYTKLFLIRSVAIEDYTVLISWIGLIGQFVPGALTTRYGCGVHIWNLRLKVFFEMLRWVNLSGIVYCPVVFFIKLSILLQYLRIFRPTGQGNMFLYIGVHICIWSTFIFYLVQTIFDVFMCNPREKIWYPLMAGHCFSTKATFQASGIFNIISDFAILILPMPSVWKLKVSLRRRIGIIAVFSTGFFACITSIMRTYYTWKAFQTEDVTYYIFKMGLWTFAETSTSLIVSCLPILPRFFQFIGPKIRWSVSSSASRTKVGFQPEYSGIRDEKNFTKFKPSITNNDRTFDSHHDPHHPRPLMGDDSFTLVRPSTKSIAAELVARESTAGSVLSPDGRRTAGDDDDLESGQHGFFGRAAHTETGSPHT